MKRQSVERYGFGPRLPTRNDRAAVLARVVLVAVTLGVLGALVWR